MVAFHPNTHHKVALNQSSDSESTESLERMGIMTGIIEETLSDENALGHMDPSNVEEVGPLLGKRNVIWLNPDDLEKLQTKKSRQKHNNSDKDIWPSYIRIGMKAYQIGCSSLVTEESFGLNTVLMKEVGDKMESAPISFCTSREIPCNPISQATFSVRPLISRFPESSSPILLDAEQVKRKILDSFAQQPLIKNQSLLLEMSRHLYLVVTLTERTLTGNLSKGQKKLGPEFYKGYISNKTGIDLEVSASPRVRLVENVYLTKPRPIVSLSPAGDISYDADEEDSDDEESPFVKLNREESGPLIYVNSKPVGGKKQSKGSHIHSDSSPIVISKTEVEEKITQKLLNQEVTLGKKIEIEIGNHQKIYATVNDVMYRSKGGEASLKEREKKSSFPLVFRPTAKNFEQAKIDLDRTSEEILVAENYCNLAENSQCEFQLSHYKNPKNADKFPQMHINVEEFQQAIRTLAENDHWFVKDDCTRLELSTGVFFFNLVNVKPGQGNPEILEGTFLKPGNITSLDLSVLKGEDVTLVDRSQTYEVESLKVKVSYTHASSVFAGLFGGEEAESEAITVTRERLDKAFKEFDRKKVFMGQKLETDFDNESALSLEIVGVDFSNKELAKEYSLLGKLSDETKIEYVPADTSKLNIFSLAPDVSMVGIEDRLKNEFGVGGLSTQFREIARRVLLSRSSNPLFQSYGSTPPKGILLYGPPGTGKTLLAKQLGKILGCTEDRTTMLDGTSIADKWVGGSEQNVRNLFKPARKEWARYKNGEISKAPLHLIIMDEVDAFLKARDEDGDPHSAKPTNAFLGQIDGLNDIGNILFVGISNRMEVLDPAVLRPGRLEIQLEIGLPDANGRKEIFEIHTKKLKGHDLLGEDLNFDTLVSQTQKFSGAQIEGAVKEATSFAQKRVEDMLIAGKAEEEIMLSPKRFVSMKDFLDAVKKRPVEPPPPPFGMYL
ncbi:MAG: ATP-dependent 26S proteasome regulatory subunit [Chlamydiales bacterium]|jgi:ATP-dependent 26S proteasome regulatory subunit